jgi:hypothetical protein
MKRNRSLTLLFACGLFALASSVASGQGSEPDGPETVMATFHVKPDQLDAFLKMMPEYWKTLREKDLVNAEPYLLMRGEEKGKPIVIEIFSWKNHDIADNAPAEVKVYWKRMNEMVEERFGHPGIEFPEMTVLQTEGHR